MTISIIKGAQVVATPKNLRGVLAYASKHPVRRVETVPLPNGKGSMRVFFLDGASCRANFESTTDMHDWLHSRRSWAGAEFFNYAETKP